MALPHQFGPLADKIAMEGADTVCALNLATRQLIESEGVPAAIAALCRVWTHFKVEWWGRDDVRIQAWIDGYDDDPRELWEVPECVAVIRAWAKVAKPYQDRRWLPTARSFLDCMGWDPDVSPLAHRPKGPRPGGTAS
jgi:hypothetical protein